MSQPKDLPMNCAPLSEFMDAEELAARHLLKLSMGFDAVEQPYFWECMVARIVDGVVTPQKAGWDVTAGNGLRIEVKFSKAFRSVLTPRPGTKLVRHVFKWAAIKRPESDAIVMIGLDTGDVVCTWAFLPSEITGASTTLTVTTPSSLVGTSRVEAAEVPPRDLLAAVTRMCRQSSARSTLDLFGDKAA